MTGKCIHICVYFGTMTSVAVAGASGYAGGELLRYLAQHPTFDLVAACAAGRAGEALAAVHPQFAGTAWSDLRLDATEASVLSQADLVFFALPHGESAALVAELDEGCLVVDLGADFRLADPMAWDRYYGGSHAGTWTYGLPELPGAREVIAASSKVANPGCYATSVALGLAPLVVEGNAHLNDVVVVAASGTSGAGRKASEALLGSNVMGDMSAYKVGGVHQHTPEMEQALAAVAGADVTLSFTPLLAPMPRGIVATCTIPVSPGTDVHEALAAAYADEAFVTVLPEGQWPHTGAVFGTNAVHIQGAYDAHASRAVVVVALDNLGKGAAGQAIQNANIICGLDEASGLDSIGVAP